MKDISAVEENILFLQVFSGSDISFAVKPVVLSRLLRSEENLISTLWQWESICSGAMVSFFGKIALRNWLLCVCHSVLHLWRNRETWDYYKKIILCTILPKWLSNADLKKGAKLVYCKGYLMETKLISCSFA